MRVRARAPISGLSAGERTLPEEVSRYLCRVLRLGAGDRVTLFDPDARIEAAATIVDASPHAALARIDAPGPAAVAATADLVLVYGLAKADKVDAVVRDATELGATGVILAQTERAVAKALGERVKERLDRLRRIAE